MSNPVYKSILSHTTNKGQDRYKIDPRTIMGFLSQGLTMEKRIPDYQRPYAWERDNVIQLFDDIRKLSKKSDTDKSWFLGPVFSTFQDGDSFSYLLDGQQRTTTIFLLLKEFVLLDFIIENYQFDNSISHIRDKYLQNKKHSENCLSYANSAGKELPRLITETLSKDFFETYVMMSPRSEKELKDARKRLEAEAEKIRSQGSNTAYVINQNAKLIAERFIEIIEDDSHVFPKNIQNLNSFIEALLHHCWLIEIPITEDEYSINIFESINNRGKKLTLVDKLRFRTLILVKNNQSREKIKQLWKELFISLEKLNSFEFIKDEEDFFKVLICSMLGKSLTREIEILHEFEITCFESDKKIIQFLEDCLRIADANLVVKDALVPNSKFISGFKKHEQHTIRCLLLLTQRMFKASENSRFLYYRNALNNYQSNTHYLFVQALWNNIRITIFEEVFKAESSNIVREKYLSIIKDNSDLNAFLNMNYIQCKKYTLRNAASNQLNLLRLKNADRASLIISMYTFFSDSASMVNKMNDLFLTHVEVEHCIPKKWKKNWSSTSFAVQDSTRFIDGYDASIVSSLDFVHIQQIISGIGNSIELPENETPDENCILEFIGNKWLLHSSDNKKISNRGWNEKISKVFENDATIKFPNNDDKLAGYKLYNQFTFKEVLDRSFKIANKIVEGFERSLFEV